MKKSILFLLLVSFFSFNVVAQNKVLFIDAGHGGKDAGPISETGISESFLNQLFADEMEILAKEQGFKVIRTTPNSNEYVSFDDRKKIINQSISSTNIKEYLISIHTNFSKDISKSGTEIYITKDDELSKGSKELAEKLRNALNATSVTQKSLQILKVPIPAVLIETGYMSNENDLNNLQNQAYRKEMILKILSQL
ncbi:MAG: N-acetylmuramoyl-L-alanine amidase [Chitinophagaceae bacterium]|nr:N-acetylmuramoyl-L-alanine amidase [Chitinophagaceae bacterium]